MFLEISYLILCWGILLLLIPKIGLIKNLGFSSLQIRLLFSLKVIIGIAYLLFYEHYYGSRSSTDAFRFYDDANTLFEVFKSDPITYLKIVFGVDMQSEPAVMAIDQLNNWYKQHLNGVFNDNMTMIRYNAVVRLISFDVYHIHTLIINLLSFLGIAAFAKAVSNYGANKKLTFLSILLFPGILFWCSGVLKETLLLFVIGFFVMYMLRLVSNFSIKNVLCVLMFFFLGILVKSYVVLSLVLGFGLFLFHRIVQKKIQYSLPTYTILLTALGGIANTIFDLRIPARIYQKQHDFLNEIALTKPGSAFELFVLEPNWWSLIKYAPNALFNALLRPFLWEAHSIISLLAAFEVFVLFAVAATAIWFRKKLTENKKILMAAFGISAVIIFLIIGWVTPVFGALVRYKIPAFIMLLLILNIIVDNKRLPIIKKWID